MRDIRGNKILLGDIVAFVYNGPNSGSLSIGQVSAFTPKQIRITFNSKYKTDTLRAPGAVVVLEHGVLPPTNPEQI